MISFANPYFLAALAGVAVPVLIHLLTRDHVKHVAFSTLRFFARRAKAVVQRKRFQELLLIAMRAAIVALLALSFERGFGALPVGKFAVEHAAQAPCFRHFRMIL